MQLPKEQLDKVLNQPECDIDCEFMGFLNVYEYLAKLIPKHWTVIDFGCAYAPQAFFFKKHKKYIGVDIANKHRFHAPNTEHHVNTIKAYINLFASGHDKNETFAICSYVPPWGGDNGELVRKNFKNVFVYYPHGGYDLTPKQLINPQEDE